MTRRYVVRYPALDTASQLQAAIAENPAAFAQAIADAIAADPLIVRLIAIPAPPDPAGYLDNSVVIVNSGVGGAGDGLNVLDSGAWSRLG